LITRAVPKRFSEGMVSSPSCTNSAMKYFILWRVGDRNVGTRIRNWVTVNDWDYVSHVPEWTTVFVCWYLTMMWPARSTCIRMSR
jgi:hypothetical protein